MRQHFECAGKGIHIIRFLENDSRSSMIKKVAGALGLERWSGVKYKKPHGWFDVGLTDGTEAFLELLEKGPLWVSRYVKKGSYHITVAKKYDDTDKGYIYYNNPLPGPKNAIEEKMVANLYTKHITDAMGSIQR